MQKKRNNKIEKYKNTKMQSRNIMKIYVAFENPKSIVIILKTNLQIKHFFVIEINIHVYLYERRRKNKKRIDVWP